MNATIKYYTQNGMTLRATRRGNKITVTVVKTGDADDLDNVNLAGLAQVIEGYIVARPWFPPPRHIDPATFQATLNTLVTTAISQCKSSKGTTLYKAFENGWTKEDIVYLGQLAQQNRKELQKTTRNFGRRAMEVLDEILAQHGLHWDMTPTQLSNWKPPTKR